NFVSRFIKESLKIDDSNDLYIINAFKNGIRPGALNKEITREKPKTASKLWNLVDNFVKGDESDRKKREIWDEQKSERKKPDDRSRGAD
ncbi:hypothetical protein, partial [Escherichia coli]|uniref:hypothetical protein n=1 Tax=Escherichia coli TaxID=562 RepID=UPI00307AC23C